MMKLHKYPRRQQWDKLTTRPAVKRDDLEGLVGKIIDDVRTEGDDAILQYSRMIDNVELTSLKVSEREIQAATAMVDDELKQAIQLAKSNIEKFHTNELYNEAPIETISGVKCWRKSVPMEKVGLYIPGGTAPLFSTVLMLAIPAKIAGCKEIILCSPPSKDGSINPVVLYTAQIVGVTHIFKVGGAQAIAAMAFGTASIPKVYKIFGPGNQYVTKAKEMVRMYGIDIDMPAGPSEVLIIADSKANPEFIAADLLSQAEHGADSQVVFVTNDKDLIPNVQEAISRQLALLPRQDIANKALSNSSIVLFKTLDECIAFSNSYAPEHLILSTENYLELADKVVNAGSVFLGRYSCESAGDYASGTNHTLPTNGYARMFSGVSIESFSKKITFQELSFEGIKNIGPAIETMAEAEGLRAHRNAVTIRIGGN